MSENFDIKYAMKQSHWEQAKGHLRAMVAIDGSVASGQVERPLRYETTGAAIEEFIQSFEDNGFHE